MSTGFVNYEESGKGCYILRDRFIESMGKIAIKNRHIVVGQVWKGDTHTRDDLARVLLVIIGAGRIDTEELDREVSLIKLLDLTESLNTALA